MGWTVSISRILNGDIVPGAVKPEEKSKNLDVVYLVAKIQRAEERVELAYQGLSRLENLRNAVLHEIKKRGYYAEAHDFGADHKADDVFKAGPLRTHVLTLDYRMAILPGLPVDPTVCPSCLQSFVPRPDTADKWTEAHNVIAANLWFQIVPRALVEFINLTGLPNNVAGIADLPRRIRDLGDEFRRSGGATRQALSGATLEMFFTTLCRAGADVGGPGASGNEAVTGAQCPTCETRHGSKSLIQRVRDGADLRALGELDRARDQERPGGRAAARAPQVRLEGLRCLRPARGPGGLHRAGPQR